MSGVAFLGRAHEMHPQAVRMLPVERDYSARSPIVAAMTLGQADSHITKPWMLELDLYSVVSPLRVKAIAPTPNLLTAIEGNRTFSPFTAT